MANENIRPGTYGDLYFELPLTTAGGGVLSYVDCRAYGDINGNAVLFSVNTHNSEIELYGEVFADPLLKILADQIADYWRDRGDLQLDLLLTIQESMRGDEIDHAYAMQQERAAS